MVWSTSVLSFRRHLNMGGTARSMTGAVLALLVASRTGREHPPFSLSEQPGSSVPTRASPQEFETENDFEDGQPPPVIAEILSYRATDGGDSDDGEDSVASASEVRYCPLQ